MVSPTNMLFHLQVLQDSSGLLHAKSLGSRALVISSQSSFLSPGRPCNPGLKQGLSALHLGLSPARKCNLQGHILQHRAKEGAPLLSQESSQQEVKRAGTTAQNRRQTQQTLPGGRDLPFPREIQPRIFPSQAGIC